MKTKDIGDRGEKEAWKFLRRKGYRLITTNYTCRGGEIDIIAQDQKTLVFIEVRSRSSTAFGTPAETVDLGKQRRIRKAAEHYLHHIGEPERYCRFDVVSVLWQGAKKPDIQLYQDAF